LVHETITTTTKQNSTTILVCCCILLCCCCDCFMHRCNCAKQQMQQFHVIGVDQ